MKLTISSLFTLIAWLALCVRGVVGLCRRARASIVEDARRRSTDPGENDVKIPPGETAAFEQVVAELGLGRLSAEDKVKELKQFFTRGFSYSLYSQTHDPGSTWCVLARRMPVRDLFRTFVRHGQSRLTAGMPMSPRTHTAGM